MLPLLKENGKIISVTSSMGKLGGLSTNLKKRLLDPNVASGDLDQIANEFFTACRNGDYASMGNGMRYKSAYCMSKVCMNIYTRILAQSPEVRKKGVQVYAVCPGWVRTDMTRNFALRGLKKGIETPIFLIDLPFELFESLQGQFFYDKKVALLTTQSSWERGIEIFGSLKNLAIALLLGIGILLFLIVVLLKKVV